LAELERQAVARSAAVDQIVELCRAEGQLAHVGGQVYLHAQWEEELRKRVQERLRDSPGLTGGEIRDLLGVTRKYAVRYCEYLDRIGLTRREGDLRVLAERVVEREGVER